MSKRIGIAITAVILGSSMFFSGCAKKIPFTNAARKQYRLTDGQVKSLQYFVSSDIVLERAEKQKNQKGTSDDGTLVISQESAMEQILIGPKTMGVCVKTYSDGKLAISFETDDKYLLFGDPNNIGRYSLYATDWKNGKGKVNYGEKPFYALPPSGSAYLLFRIKKIKKSTKSTKTIKGRKV